MSLKTLTRTLEHYDAKYKCEILRVLVENSSAVFSAMTEYQVLEVAEKISQVSGGAGLDILSIVLWPEDELSGALSDLPEKIKEKLDNYIPGQFYSATGDA